ncbi:VOC family protein [Bacillus sp. SCS-153A]|uniref:VOC family protein n=1 Tax=Rossellomorea sedimentorum TaxID=3115294 RepID=UPI003905DDAD
MILNKIPTVFIPVVDLKKSVKWYSEVFGFNLDFEQWEQIDSLPVYTFAMDSSYLTLDANIAAQGEFKPSKYPLCNIACQSISEVWDRFGQLGVERIDKITSFPNLSFFNFKDPDGNVLMMCSE